MTTRIELQTELEEIVFGIWNEFKAVYPALESFPIPKAIFNYRLKTTAGQNSSEINQIEINPKMYMGNRRYFIKSIIPHEIAHQVVCNLYGNVGDFHGPEWQIVMIDYGIDPNKFHSLKG